MSRKMQEGGSSSPDDGRFCRAGRVGCVCWSGPEAWGCDKLVDRVDNPRFVAAFARAREVWLRTQQHHVDLIRESLPPLVIPGWNEPIPEWAWTIHSALRGGNQPRPQAVFKCEEIHALYVRGISLLASSDKEAVGQACFCFESIDQMVFDDLKTELGL